MALPTTQNYHIICKTKSTRGINEVIMTYISKEEEDDIDNLGTNLMKITRGNRTFNIRLNKIYCYGKIDFNNEGDINQIKRFKFLKHLDANGIPFPAYYNYERHEGITNGKYYSTTETWSTVDVAKFGHACLGKPERLIIFKTM